MDPYRAAAPDDRPRIRATRERDLLIAGAVVWIASVARVAFAFARQETFGAIATLAMCFALGLPVLVLTSFRRPAPRER